MRLVPFRDLRANPELQSAIVRLGIMLAAIIFFETGDERASDFTLELSTIRYLVGGFSALAILVFLSIFFVPASTFRRYMTLAADIFANSIAVYVVGDVMSPFILVYVWIFVAYSSRYGIGVLFTSSLITSVTYLMSVAALGHLESDRASVSFVVLALVLIPFYMHSLLKRLYSARQDAVDASQAKDRFLATISHELRTPLSGIIGMGKLLRATPMSAEQIGYLSPLTSSAEVLREMINDLLDLSRMETGKLQLHQGDFDFEALVLDVCRLMNGIAIEKNLKMVLWIDPAIPHHLKGDELRIRQVLYNLVGNAVKFTLRGEVFVSVEMNANSKPGQCDISITVKDTGPGIPADALSSVFERFWQLDSSVARKYGGSGLGTSVVKELVALMGGEVNVESEVGRGSVFVVRLILPETEAMQGQPEIQRVLEGKNALVLSKNGTLSSVLGRYARFLGADVLQVRLSMPVETILLSPADEIAVAFVDADFRSVESVISLVKETYGSRCLIVCIGHCKGRCGVDICLEGPFSAATLDSVIRQSEVYEHVAKVEVKPVLMKKTKRLHILVAEDDPINRKFVTILLQRMGYKVTAVEDGMLAWNMLLEQEFDLGVLDLRMPGLDGTAVIRRWRDREKQQQIPWMPIIVLTADVVGKARDDCEKAGADVFLTKPVDENALQESIDELMAAGRE